MAIQTFNLPVDFLNNLERPPIYIAKKDKTILGAVSIYDDLSLTFNLNAYQTASFKIYRDINGKRQKHYDDFQEDRLIMIQGIGWYKIHVETNIENAGISKSITANSLECTLCNKRLIDFECNTGEILYDDYVRTIFYDPSNPKGSLLHRVLNVAPSWSIGHVDDSLADMQRSFNVDDNDVYSFLTGDVSKAFNCLFIFDTFNQTVNAYDLDNYGEDTSIYVSMDNLAQSMTESINENSIITCYRVNGGDGIYINEVNPNSTNKIYNFEYYLPEMEESLQNKVKLYNEKYQSLKPQYEEIMKRLGDQIGVIQELETRLPDDLNSKDWTKYGLQFLDSKVKSFKTMDELYCAQGMNKPDNLSYNLYLQNLEDLNSVTAEYNKRESEVDSATEVYNSIIAERNAVQAQLDMDEWFTLDEWKSLDCYVVEETYDNDNFITTDNTTDTERFDIERQLYETAWKDLSKKCRPQYQYTSTLSNVLTIPQFKGFLKYFQLGNFIRMATDYDTVIKLRLISFTVDYNDTSKIDVTFSDAIRVHDIYDDAASIQAQANSAAMSFQFNKDQYDKSVNESNFVAEMRKYGLDVATTQIHNSKNQSQVWDESGMTFRMWNDERQDFDPEQIKIINNMMVFSDDGFKTSKMAIGKIPIDKNGNYGYGINAEFLMSKLVMSQNLWIENDSGTYKFDDAGFIASSGKNSVRIQPNKSGELFSIYKENNRQVYINSDGDVQFSGLVSGGSININNTFTVDKYGNVTAKSGAFSCDITGSSGTFGGVTIDSNGLSSNQFSIDMYGNASFSGTLSATSIMSSGVLNGYLTSSDLGSSGTTSIDGGRIKTGTISADRIDADNLVAKNGNFTKSFNVEIPIAGSSTKKFVIRAQSDDICFIGREEYDSGLEGNIIYGIYFKGHKAYYYSDNESGEIITTNSTLFARASSGTLSNPTLTGNIDAIGIKGRSSSGTANVRCQNGSDHGYLAISAESSMRYKHDIADISDDRLNPERLYDLPIRQFVYNFDYLDVNDQRYGETVCGFIAEEIAKVYPVACEYNADGLPENWDIRYVIPPMLSLIQKQHQEIESIKQENLALQNRLLILESRMEELENVINNKNN